MQCYLLYTNDDVVCEVVRFSNGKTVLQWKGDVQSTVIHDKFENVKKLHVDGHQHRHLLRNTEVHRYTDEEFKNMSKESLEAIYNFKKIAYDVDTDNLILINNLLNEKRI